MVEQALNFWMYPYALRFILLLQKSQVTSLFGAEVLWSKGYTGAKVKMAIFDTGIRANHPHFRNIKVTLIVKMSWSVVFLYFYRLEQNVLLNEALVEKPIINIEVIIRSAQTGPMRIH